MLELLDIPVEVFHHNILPLFPWNDLLRFRRVCWLLKRYTDTFIKNSRHLPPCEIEITCEEGKTVSDFLLLDFPIPRIYFNKFPSAMTIFDNAAQVRTFLHRFGDVITHLRFHNLSIHLFLNENRQFFEGLVNLESLEFETVGPCTNNEGYKALALPPIQTLKNLKSLQVDTGLLPLATSNDIILIQRIKKQCGSQLEYLKLPRVELIKATENGDVPIAMEGMKGTLKYFDFGTFHDKGIYGNLCLDADIRCPNFPSICNAFAAANVKLVNVPAGFFENYYWLGNNPDVWEIENQNDVGKAVISLINLHLAVNDLEMPNLEKITITSVKRTSMSCRFDEACRPCWSRLKILDITIDAKTLAPTGLFPATITSTNALYHFMFRRIYRPSVEELCLQFTDMENLPVPKSEDILEACPNLKKLVLINWQGTNEALNKFWEGLPFLEEVHLEKCKSIGNVAFFGDDVENPIFKKLEKLKKLSLKGLDCMPKITDAVFRLIFRCMKLKQLILESDKEMPLANVTVHGIRALLTGPFAQSIDKFPLNKVYLQGISADEMRELEARFRSFNML